MFFLTILTILSSYILYKTIQGVFFILCDNMVSLDGSISINLNQSIYLEIPWIFVYRLSTIPFSLFTLYF